MKKKLLILTGIAFLLVLIGLAVRPSESIEKTDTTKINSEKKMPIKKLTKPSFAPKNEVKAAEKAPKSPAKIDTTKWLTSPTEMQFPILMYHSLSSGNSLRVPPTEFEQHMAWLKQNGYYTLTPEEAYLVLTENKKPAEKIVWIVFDDGYQDNYQAGFPILKKLNMKATICFITGNEPLQNFIQMPELKEMKDSGLVNIESHTVNHQELNRLTPEQQKSEMLQSKNWLDQQLEQKTSVLCYPVGRFNEQTGQLAKDSGYKLALTTQPGLAHASQGLMNLHRVRVTPNMDGQHFGQMLMANQ